MQVNIIDMGRFLVGLLPLPPPRLEERELKCWGAWPHPVLHWCYTLPWTIYLCSLTVPDCSLIKTYTQSTNESVKNSHSVNHWIIQVISQPINTYFIHASGSQWIYKAIISEFSIKLFTQSVRESIFQSSINQLISQSTFLSQLWQKPINDPLVWLSDFCLIWIIFYFLFPTESRILCMLSGQSMLRVEY